MAIIHGSCTVHLCEAVRNTTQMYVTVAECRGRAGSWVDWCMYPRRAETDGTSGLRMHTVCPYCYIYCLFGAKNATVSFQHLACKRPAWQCTQRHYYTLHILACNEAVRHVQHAKQTTPWRCRPFSGIIYSQASFTGCSETVYRHQHAAPIMYRGPSCLHPASTTEKLKRSHPCQLTRGYCCNN